MNQYVTKGDGLNDIYLLLIFIFELNSQVQGQRRAENDSNRRTVISLAFLLCLYLYLKD